MRTAPGLREVAETWWDVERDPVVAWSDDGCDFWLADPEDPTNRLELARFPTAVADPERVAAVLADGLAACDFPPTGQQASPARVVTTLRVAGMSEVPSTGQE